jgi:hypothetical protein
MVIHQENGNANAFSAVAIVASISARTYLTLYEEKYKLVIEHLNWSTVVRLIIPVWSVSLYTGITEGKLFFTYEFRLCLREELDFAAGLITSYKEC